MKKFLSIFVLFLAVITILPDSARADCKARDGGSVPSANTDNTNFLNTTNKPGYQYPAHSYKCGSGNNSCGNDDLVIMMADSTHTREFDYDYNITDTRIYSCGKPGNKWKWSQYDISQINPCQDDQCSNEPGNCIILQDDTMVHVKGHHLVPSDLFYGIPVTKTNICSCPSTSTGTDKLYFDDQKLNYSPCDDAHNEKLQYMPKNHFFNEGTVDEPKIYRCSNDEWSEYDVSNLDNCDDCLSSVKCIDTVDGLCIQFTRQDLYTPPESYTNKEADLKSNYPGTYETYRYSYWLLKSGNLCKCDGTAPAPAPSPVPHIDDNDKIDNSPYGIMIQLVNDEIKKIENNCAPQTK